MLIWTLAWDARAVTARLPLFDANIYYPEGDALRFAEHHIGLAAAALPFQLAAGPVFAYWSVWLLSFPLNALAMYLLAIRVTGDRGGALVAGLVYAFCFFRMHHAHGHLQMLWTWPLPLVPLAMERAIRAPTWARTAAVAALVIAQALTSWYLAVLVALLGAIAAAILVPRSGWSKTHTVHAGAAGAVIVGALAWAAAPYLALQPGGSVEAASMSADLKGYLLPPANTWLGRHLPATLEPRAIWGEQTIYAGATTLALGVAGLIAAWRRGLPRVGWAVLAAGAVALALSFGPSPTGWSPFDLLARLPGLSLLRAPARLALLVMLALALLSALGISALRARYGRSGALAGGALALAILAEAFVVDFPAGKPQVFPVPEVYHRLASLPPGAVLSLPAYRATPEAFRDADYLYFSTVHWRPIVNGYGRQEPPAHAALMQTLNAFPAAAAVQALRSIGVRYVILNPARASELGLRVEEAGRTPAVTHLGTFGDDWLFEIRPVM